MPEKGRQLTVSAHRGEMLDDLGAQGWLNSISAPSDVRATLAAIGPMAPIPTPEPGVPLRNSAKRRKFGMPVRTGRKSQLEVRPLAVTKSPRSAALLILSPINVLVRHCRSKFLHQPHYGRETERLPEIYDYYVNVSSEPARGSGRAVDPRPPRGGYW